ncbi:MAG: response regulator [Spirosomataceae bacterium]
MEKGKVNIFYVDDDADDRLLFEAALSEINDDAKLTVMEDSDELLHILENPPPTPNLIFVDLNMPRKNGYQVLKEIKSNHSFKRLPVLILTTSAEKTIMEKARSLGADAFITKPSNFNSLKSILRKCLTAPWGGNAKNNFIIQAD